MFRSNFQTSIISLQPTDIVICVVFHATLAKAGNPRRHRARRRAARLRRKIGARKTTINADASGSGTALTV
jgi:hypothetical protein